MHIPSFIIDDLLSRVSIIDLLDRNVSLRKLKVGMNGKATACCPFHDDKSPSLSLNDEKGVYHCFGCGEKGNAIEFLMKHNNYGFIDAIKDICEIVGVDYQSIRTESSKFNREENVSPINTSNSQNFSNWLLNNYSGYDPLRSNSESNVAFTGEGISSEIFKLVSITQAFSTGTIENFLARIKEDEALLQAAKEAGIIENGRLIYPDNKILVPLFEVVNYSSTSWSEMPVVNDGFSEKQLTCIGFKVLDSNLNPIDVYPPKAKISPALHLPILSHSNITTTSDNLFLVDNPDSCLELLKSGVMNVTSPSTPGLTALHLRQLKSFPTKKITWITTKESLIDPNIVGQLNVFNEVLGKTELNFVFLKDVSPSYFRKILISNPERALEKLETRSVSVENIFPIAFTSLSALSGSQLKIAIRASTQIIKKAIEKGQMEAAKSYFISLLNNTSLQPHELLSTVLRISKRSTIQILENLSRENPHKESVDYLKLKKFIHSEDALLERSLYGLIDDDEQINSLIFLNSTTDKNHFQFCSKVMPLIKMHLKATESSIRVPTN